MLIIALALGVFAGMLTTVAGVGGGAMLLLGLSLLWDPWQALAVSAPALLVGNAHRASLFWRTIHWKTAGLFLAGALPASIIGGLFVSAVPAGVLYAAMAAMVVLALLKRAGALDFTPPTNAMLPFGVGIGVLTAGVGGGGIMVAPLLLAAGFTGPAYIATGAVISTGMHLGRFTGYGLDGAVGVSTLIEAMSLAVAITAGNLLGKAIRRRVAETATRRLEVGALLFGAGLAVFAALH